MLIDLTNWCARLVWTTNKNVTQTFITTNNDFSVYKFTIEPLLGKLTLMIPPETTNNFAFNNAKYDLELQSDEDFYYGAALTLGVDATTTNTGSKVVARDASGNFAAGIVTASGLTGVSTANPVIITYAVIDGGSP